jgi:hypothetical protein
VELEVVADVVLLELAGADMLEHPLNESKDSRRVTTAAH